MDLRRMAHDLLCLSSRVEFRGRNEIVQSRMLSDSSAYGVMMWVDDEGRLWLMSRIFRSE